MAAIGDDAGLLLDDDARQRLDHGGAPQRVGDFVYDLGDPAVAEAVRQLGAHYGQWDVLFDAAWSRSPADPQPVFSPSSPRQELRNLVLPFRF